jgi:hypothetical protein
MSNSIMRVIVSRCGTARGGYCRGPFEACSIARSAAAAFRATATSRMSPSSTASSVKFVITTDSNHGRKVYSNLRRIWNSPASEDTGDVPKNLSIY